MKKVGALIVFEGVDGSGKTTQCEQAMEWLRETEKEVVTFDFPAYDRSMFGKMIGSFLKGEFGDPLQCDPFESTILFAGDRYHDQMKMTEALNRGAIVVLNRYVSSNVAYSCAKLRITGREAEIPRFKQFSDNLEYLCFSLPKPDLVILLNMDTTYSSSLIDSKAPRDYLNGDARDAHETSMHLQITVRDEYLDLAEANRDSWQIIECVEYTEQQTQRLRSIEEIQKEVKDKIRDALYQGK